MYRLVAALVFCCFVGQANAQETKKDDLSKLPQWQRVLKGEDAKKAKELNQKIEASVATDRFDEAVKLQEEVVELRTRVQGADHWEVANVRGYLKTLRMLDAAGRREWQAANTANKEATQLNAKGRYAEAQPFFQKALNIRRKILGEEHPVTAGSYNNVAGNLNAQGKAAEAQPLYQKALDICRKVLGEEHPDTATSYNNVAYNLDSQGKAAEAQPLLQKALDIRRKVLGEEDPGTADSYSSLAFNLSARGKAAEAAPLLQKALDISRKVLGEEHPQTANSYNNLATNLDFQGKAAVATPFHEKALAILRKVLGEGHPETANSYSNLAYNLNACGKPAEAGPLYQKALDIRRKVLGEEHPDTALSYHNLAANLSGRGKAAEAAPLLQKALDIRRRVLGEEHPDTALSYNGLAHSLNERGKAAEAALLYQKALDIYRKALGEEHPQTASIYSNLAYNLMNGLGKAAEAAPLYRKVLDISRKVLGEEHPDTALSYNGLAANLQAQGKAAEAAPLFRRALDISRKVLGEEHPNTALSYNGLAVNLQAQGKAAEAAPLFQRALDISLKVLGEEHPDIALRYNNLAGNLLAQRKAPEATPLHRKALDIRRKVLGEEHSDTAQSYNNLAGTLNAMGKLVEAQPLYERSLDIRRKVLGEEHPDTAISYANLTINLAARGKIAEAIVLLKQAVYSYEASRLTGAKGIERASLREFDTRLLLAAFVNASDPLVAWGEFELSLARGLLDHQRGGQQNLSSSEEAQLAREREHVDAVQPRILTLVAHSNRSEAETAELEKLLAERRKAEERLAGLAVIASKREVAKPKEIQAAIPTDAALLFWVDVTDNSSLVQEHFACVVRSKGEPVWVRLPGTGEENKWTQDDSSLPGELRVELQANGYSPKIMPLAAKLRAQRIEPVLKHLGGVKTLYVVGVNEMAGIPVELLAPEFTIGFVPSGTFLARRGKPLDKPTTLLALGDPVFPKKEPAKVAMTLPPGGLLISQVVPEGAAAKARLQADDVLVSYAGAKLDSVEQLGKLIAEKANEKEVTIEFWREAEDKVVKREIPPGRLGVILAKEPARQAIVSKRETNALMAKLNRGGAWNELPGTQVEVSELEKLFGKESVTSLTRSRASEEALEAMRKKGDLGKFRYLHFATHGEANNVRAFDSKLILAQDKPTEFLAKQGEPWMNNELSAREVLDHWKLDSDLVTLSACETALGKLGGGDGMLGFAQAFLLAGSRAVCLSLWKVDDTATALLMDRFYRNLLGKREDGAKPMGKAAALSEAKKWLQQLSLKEATDRLGTITEGVSRGGRPAREVMQDVPTPKDPKDNKPYAHPKYWAAFILIGDPD